MRMCMLIRMTRELKRVAYSTSKNLYVSEEDLCLWSETETWCKENKIKVSALVRSLLSKHLASEEVEVRCLFPDNGHTH